MAQTITDYSAFLTDAREAVEELAGLERREAELEAQEKRLERTLEAEKKAVADAIHSTIRRRNEEICSSYDKEIAKGQERLKKIRSKREKAKSQGVKDRIAEETSEIRSHNRELRIKMRTLFQQKHVPFFCNSGCYYALFSPRGVREFFALFCAMLVCFLAVPFGIYWRIPEKTIVYLFAIYFCVIVVFGGLYIAVSNWTKGRYGDTLREGRAIRNQIQTNNQMMRVITRNIKKDKDEAIYDLQKFDDEIAQLEQDLEQTAKKKKEALNTFDNVTRTIIADEIANNSQPRIDGLTEELKETARQRRYVETIVKEKKIFITDNSGIYTGREFLTAERLDALKALIDSGEAKNISEAIDIYKNTKK